jgi:glutathione S-transferase
VTAGSRGSIAIEEESTLDPAQQSPDALLVYGTDCSYFTGKLEAYLRAKGIAYRLVPFGPSNMKRAARHTGVTQIPQVECADGSWLVDTTLILEHFERVRPEPAMHSHVPSVAFVSRLIEDFADEWLWRPAMHWRWSFPENARLMSAWLAEHAAESRAPLWLKRLYWRRRQLGTFVRGDGVDAAARGAVERTYFDLIDALERIFARRPYVFGERPLEADFGLFGPLFRHFASDPAPARVMRERAPGVYEWVARMWNARPERFEAAPIPDAIPDDLGALFAIVTQAYLPYLEANALAHARGESRVRYLAQGASYDEPTKPYRVWCRDRLHENLVQLDPGERSAVEHALAAPEALSHLAVASAKPVEDLVGPLPIPATAERAPVDSWWRRR